MSLAFADSIFAMALFAFHLLMQVQLEQLHCLRVIFAFCIQFAFVCAMEVSPPVSLPC